MTIQVIECYAFFVIKYSVKEVSIMSYRLTEKAMLKGVEKMNSFGPRYTGSEAHRNYIDYLKKEAEKLGYKTW